MNGDCVLDMAVVNSGTDDLTVFHGIGDGDFVRTPGHRLGQLPRGLAIADFD